MKTHDRRINERDILVPHPQIGFAIRGQFLGFDFLRMARPDCGWKTTITRANYQKSNRLQR